MGKPEFTQSSICKSNSPELWISSVLFFKKEFSWKYYPNITEWGAISGLSYSEEEGKEGVST